jgi:6-phosphogluconolactonase (cycloisomerase 2 family)
VVPYFAYAVESGTGVVTRFVMDQTTWKLSEVGSITVATPLEGPHGLLITRSRRFLYTASGGTGEILGFEINPADGALTPILGFSANCGPGSEWMTEHPSGNFLYASNDQTGAVCGFAIDSQTGALSSLVGSPFQAGSNASYVAMDPEGKFLYVPDSITSTVHAFTIDATSGDLTQVVGAPFASNGTDAWTAAVGPSGGYLFVVNFNSVDLHSIDRSTGALSMMAVPPISLTALPQFPVFDASGRFLYLPDSDFNSDGYIHSFAFDANTGALSPVPGGPFYMAAAFGVQDVTLNNSLTHAYVMNYATGELLTFTVDTDGALTLVDTVTLRPDIYKLTLWEYP